MDTAGQKSAKFWMSYNRHARTLHATLSSKVTLRMLETVAPTRTTGYFVDIGVVVCTKRIVLKT
jgi:hypothetical protein